MAQDFETGTPRRTNGNLKVPSGTFSRYKPQLVVCSLVIVVLAGGAYYSSRASESAPRVVYSMSLEDAVVEAQTPLVVDLNTADAEDLEELPEVGPSTADAIIEYRNANGDFETVDDLEEVPGIGPKTLEQIKPFATV